MMTIDAFKKKFSKLSLDEKIKTAKNIETTLASGVSPKGTKMKETERKALEELASWAMFNIMVGNELAPPENVLK